MWLFRAPHGVSGFLLLTLILVCFQNCGQPFHSEDQSSVDTGLTSPEELRFKAASTVIQAKCASCHSEGGSASFAPFTFNSEGQFISAGLISPGDPSKSKLIYRLKNYPDTSITNRNMPTTGSLSADEYSAIYLWVSKILPTDSAPFTCNTNDSLDNRAVAKNIKRLSQRQYLNSIRDLLGRAFAANTSSSLLNQASSTVSLPTDDDSSFSRFDGSVVMQHMRGYFEIADALANSVTNSTHYSTLVNSFINLDRGSCVSVNPTSLTTACATQFINNFGTRALRRPLTSEERGVFTTVYTNAGGNAAGINAIVFRFLMAPQFLYKIENGGSVVTGSLLKISSYEVASRLSYMFWNSMPDEELLNRARSEDLSEDSHFLSALNYVADHDKSQDSMSEFTSEWLHLKNIPQFATNNASLNYLANGITLDSSLRTAMISEVQELSQYVYRNNMTFEDLFTTNVSFARDSRLLSIYGLSNAAATYVTPQNAVRFPESERGGILTRAALLVGGSELANPIKRGIRIRKDILCLPLANPPAELEEALEPPEPNINLTTRQRYDHATSPTACMNCHQYINSLGHGLGSYNSFGKYETQEPTFDQNGNFSGRYLPISTQVDLSTSLAPGISASNPHQLSRLVAEQETTMRCFSEKALRFAEGRTENKNKEGCRLNGLYSKLNQAQSLKEFFKSLAQDSEFRHRLLQDAQ